MSNRSTPVDTALTRAGAPAQSILDRRRDNLQAASRIAAAAAAKVDALDKRLDADMNKRHRHEAALRTALDSVAVQKKAIKTATKDRVKHRAARKEARSNAAKAKRSADAAEAKYDRAVLADMVRREKDNDLSAHDGTNAAATTSKKNVAKDPKSRQESGKVRRRPKSTPVKPAKPRSGHRSSATKTTKASRTSGSARRSTR